MHAWAVPVSYHYLLANSGPALDKRLNLWGSTQSHEKYFEKLIGMILNHLKRSELPLLEGFVDVGCGDGSLLKALRRVMKQEFDRPFVYIGFDLDEESSGIAKENASEGILFLKGDVARPDELNECLISRGLPSLDRFFHMRAFVDHNCRPFFRQFQGDPMPDHFGYCYLHDGRLVSMEFVEESFGGHFVRWKPFVQRNGLGIIELHNVEEYDLTESPAIAYEIFHLLSEQYVMPYHRYAELWKHTGLRLMDRARIPEGISNTNVSISIYGS
jgi:SAM-dependent methyltransferase